KTSAGGVSVGFCLRRFEAQYGVQHLRCLLRYFCPKSAPNPAVIQMFYDIVFSDVPAFLVRFRLLQNTKRAHFISWRLFCESLDTNASKPPSEQRTNNFRRHVHTLFKKEPPNQNSFKSRTFRAAVVSGIAGMAARPMQRLLKAIDWRPSGDLQPMVIL